MTQFRCDECGRSVKKMHRRYQGTGYCGSCYARVFKPASCPRCYRFARIPNNIPGAVCKACIASRPCIRCGRAGRPLGLIHANGNVCNSCAPHFKEPSPCEVCGRLSKRLTKVTRFADQLKRCERCAVADFGTCIACRRYRKLGVGGSKLCKLCSSGDQKPCEECGCMMPPGRVRRCEACYWEQLLAKRCRMNRETLESEYFRDSLSDFTSWLKREIGVRKAALSVARFTTFFASAEQRSVSLSSYEALLSEFGVDYLRRHQKIIQWLVAARGLEVDQFTKTEAAELKRIQRILARVPTKSIAHELIAGFWDEQEARYVNSEVSILTIRLGLTPATAFLKMCDFKKPTSQALAAYLAKAPGQRASITKFISYLNSTHGFELQLPNKQTNLSGHRAMLEKRLVQLASDSIDKFDLNLWCVTAMEVFHGIKVARGDFSSGNLKIREIREGFYIDYCGKKYFLPGPQT